MSVSSGRYRSSLPKLSRARVVKVTGPLEWAHISYSAKNRPTSLHKQRELFKSMLRAEWHPEENVLSQTRWTVYVGSTCGHHERVPESALSKILRVPSIYVSVLSTQTAYWILRQATCAADAPKGGSSGRTLKVYCWLQEKIVFFYLFVLLLLLSLTQISNNKKYHTYQQTMV